MRNLIIYSLLITISASSFLPAQSHISIHQQEYEKHKSEIKKLSKFSHDGQGIIPLDTTISSELTRSVFGYLPDWEYTNGAYKNLQYKLLSHIAAFAFSVSNDGNITDPSAWPWTDMINKAHSNGVKVVMTAVNFTAGDIHQIISDSTVKANFIRNVKNKINTYKLDGINIDFENVSTADNGSLINKFMKELSDSVHTAFPGKEVSFAAPAVNWGGWDLAGLANSCDYLFVMGYDFFGSWSTTTGPTAPLVGGGYNITNTINVQYQSVTQNHPEKLILGVPYYGCYWNTSNGNPGSSVIKFISNPLFSPAQSNSETYGILWNTQYQTTWYRWNNGKWYQVWFDNDSALALKYNLAISKNLKGVGMWALGYDGARQELWNLISYKFGTGVIPAPSTPGNFYATAETDSSIRLDYSIPPGAGSFLIYVSEDGINFDSLKEVINNDIVINGLKKGTVYYFKVKAKNRSGLSHETGILAARTLSYSNALIVDGTSTADSIKNENYIYKYADPLIKNYYGFSSSSNEAIVNNAVDLNKYNVVIWISGSKSNETFIPLEQEKIKTYLKNGGNILISGSNIGYDLEGRDSSTANDTLFYFNYLKSHYVSNLPGNDSGEYYSAESIDTAAFRAMPELNFDDGTHGTYDVNGPDAIKAADGGEDIFKYVNLPLDSGAAGIAFKGNFPGGIRPGGLVYLAFPFETIYPDSNRIFLLTKILEYFNATVNISEAGKNSPAAFKLYQNFPNPFNPSTTISFSIPARGKVKLEIFDILGRIVWEKSLNDLSAGYHQIVWNGINMNGIYAASGVYLFRLKYNTSDNQKILFSKMILQK